MLRSLYSGVSGMRSNQTKMDVVGNNISNASTTAYKSSRARFEDMFSQTVASSQGPSTTNRGGVNAKQIGLGVSVSGIDNIMTGGSLQPTNRDLDFAIEGEGFFIVSNKADASDKLFTRDGVFFRDGSGNLVNSNGQRVLGENQDPHTTNVPGDPGATGDLKALIIPNTHDGDPSGKPLDSFSIDGSGLITGKYGGDTYYIGKIAMAKFSNPEGLEKMGGNTYINTVNSGAVEVGVSGGKGFGNIRQGVIEMSNVDLANEMTEMIITSRAYQANSRTITTSDEMLQELVNLKR